MRALPMWAARFLAMLLVMVVASAVVTATPRSATAEPGAIPTQRGGSANGLGHAASAKDTTTGRRAGDHDAPPARGLAEDTRRQDPRPPSAAEEPGGFTVGEPSPGAVAKGYDPATSEELPEKGARDRQVFLNADGTETTRYYSGKQFFQDAAGGWRKIDPTLVGEGSGWRVKADSRGKRFAGSADDNALAEVELAPGKSVAFGVSQAAAAKGVVSGDSVRYPGVRPDADLRLQATPLGVKETIILKSVDAPTVWEFPLALTGLSATLVDGEVQLTDSTGALVGRIPRGYMEDSAIDPRSGDGVRSDSVTYELLGSPGEQVLRVSVDPEWVADPARKFPILVDPTVTEIESHGDTYVMYPYTNDYSSETILKVGTYNGGSNKAAALLKFSVGSLKNHQILGAKLYLNSIWSYSCSARDLYVRPLSESWSVTGNKSWPGPSYGTEITRKSFAYGYSVPRQEVGRIFSV